MNNTFSLQQIFRTSNLDANLISRQYKLNLMADLLRMKYEDPKLKQSEKTNQLGYSFSTLQRYIIDINILSPYKLQSNNNNKRTKKASNTNFNNDSHREPDSFTSLERPQMTSNDLKTTQTNTKSNRKKKKPKNGSVHENVEINEHYLDESLHKNNLKMELAMQIVSKDKTVRSNAVIDLKVINNQTLATQVKKGEQLVSMMQAIRKAFDIIGDDIVEMSTENDALKKK